MTTSEKPRRGQNLTLEHIGERAGVSRSTVSRVLNNHPDVRPQVRARVEAVIRETGYAPNQAARALVSSKTNLIGLIMLTEIDEFFGDAYYSALVRGIQEGCVDHGHFFAIFPAYRSDDSSPDRVLPQIAQGFVDGVIVTAGPRSEPLISLLRDQGTPMVVVGHPADDVGLTRVDVENREGSAAAVAHLIAHDHQRIGFVGATPEYLFGRERLEGYNDALHRAGRQVDDRLIRLERPNAAGGYRATAALLSERPDAIFVSTDPMATGAYRAVRDNGFHIPGDVAIVGFDGLPSGPQMEPTLTTVVQPVVDVGRTAVGLLVSEETEPGTTVVLPTRLRLGQSCGADDVHRHIIGAT